MQKAVLILVLGIAGGVVGGYLGRALGDKPADLRATARDPSGARALELIEELRQEMNERLRARDAGSAAPADRSASATPVAVGEKPAAKAEVPTDEPVEGKGSGDPLDGILGKPFGSRESNRLFMRLSTNPDRIDGTIEKLKKEIEKNPNSADLQVALATAWVAKTASMPPSPAQGVVWAQAEAAYDAAIKLDPNHWQARFGKAFGESMAPEFVGLRPAAIKQFEELVELQESLPQAPEHSQSYYRLGTLYKDAGNPDKARQVWERGRKFFPDDQQLKEALDLLAQR